MILLFLLLSVYPQFGWKSDKLDKTIYVDCNYKIENSEDYRFGIYREEKNPNAIHYDSALKVANYYLIGKTNENGYSDRYNPASDMFQAWIGCYVINSKNKFSIPYIVKEVLIKDQAMLLKFASGMESPTMLLDQKKIKVTTLISKIDTIYKVDFVANGNLDKGWNDGRYCKAFETPKDIWNGILTGKEIVKYHITFYIRHHSDNLVTVQYFNGIEFTDLNKVTHNTYSSVEKEFNKMIGDIKFIN